MDVCAPCPLAALQKPPQAPQALAPYPVTSARRRYERSDVASAVVGDVSTPVLERGNASGREPLLFPRGAPRGAAARAVRPPATTLVMAPPPPPPPPLIPQSGRPRAMAMPLKPALKRPAEPAAPAAMESVCKRVAGGDAAKPAAAAKPPAPVQTHRAPTPPPPTSEVPHPFSEEGDAGFDPADAGVWSNSDPPAPPLPTGIDAAPSVAMGDSFARALHVLQLSGAYLLSTSLASVPTALARVSPPRVSSPHEPSTPRRCAAMCVCVCK